MAAIPKEVCMKKLVEPGKIQSSARNSMLIMIVLTFINMFLSLFVAGANFPYSVYFAWVGSVVVRLSVLAYGINGIAIIWLILVVAQMLFFIVAWQRSSRNPKWLLSAGILYVLDTLFMLWYQIYFGYDIAYLFDLAMHLWILFSLFVGYNSLKRDNSSRRDVVFDLPKKK